VVFLTIPEAKKQTSFLGDIASGAAGTRQTLILMRDLTRKYRKDLNLRNLAANLVGNLRQKDFNGEIKLLHAFVRDSIRYLKDIHGVETIQTPAVTLQNQFGDCDDKATLLATLLESIGHPTRFVAVGFRNPGEYSHVYVETRAGNRASWIPLETTENVPAGWAPKKVVTSLRVYN
jgi:transglutaminase-like putative cysteine protease